METGAPWDGNLRPGNFRNFLRGMETRKAIFEPADGFSSETSLEGWKQGNGEGVGDRAGGLPKLP